MVEDFSITFEALGKLPGPLIKWFLMELGPDGLCRILDSYDNRRACAQTHFAIWIDGAVTIFEGRMDGTIAKQPRGEHGFGTDAIFIPDGYTKTWGQMSDEEQIKSSIRRMGLKKLEAYLHSK